MTVSFKARFRSFLLEGGGAGALERRLRLCPESFETGDYLPDRIDGLEGKVE